MTKNISFGLFLLSICTGCNPYTTKKINRISKEDQREAIYVAYPIVETRRQATIDSFYKDPDKEIYDSALSFTNNALHKLLGKKGLPIRFAEFDSVEYSKSKALLDSVLGKFMISEVKDFDIHQELKFQTERNLILIPYLIWTRSTSDYSDWGRKDGKCVKIGRNSFRGNNACLWTQSQTILLVINIKNKEIVYFKYSQWDTRPIFSPYEKRIMLNFKHCAQPLLRKLG